MENVEGGDAVLHAGTGAPPSNPLEAGEEVNPAAERKLWNLTSISHELVKVNWSEHARIRPAGCSGHGGFIRTTEGATEAGRFW